MTATLGDALLLLGVASAQIGVLFLAYLILKVTGLLKHLPTSIRK